jgi:hypothetical protein
MAKQLYKKEHEMLAFIAQSDHMIIDEQKKMDIKVQAIIQEREQMKMQLMTKLGMKRGDRVKMVFNEYRDDNVSCFQAAQSFECALHDVQVMETYNENKERFMAPVIRLTDKNGAMKLKDIKFNEYLSWMMFDDKGKLVLMHMSEQVILDGKYTPEKLEELRKRAFEAQRVK